MAIIRWNPWNLSSLLDDDWDLPTIPGLSRVMGQGMDIFEDEDSIVAQVSVPGVPEDKIDISVDDGVVKISAVNQRTEEEKNKRRYFMSTMTQNYNYSFRLPEKIIKDQEPDAELEDGVLTLRFKKAEKVSPKKIKVLRKGKEGSKQISATSKNR